MLSSRGRLYHCMHALCHSFPASFPHHLPSLCCCCCHASPPWASSLHSLPQFAFLSLLSNLLFLLPSPFPSSSYSSGHSQHASVRRKNPRTRKQKEERRRRRQKGRDGACSIVLWCLVWQTEGMAALGRLCSWNSVRCTPTCKTPPPPSSAMLLAENCQKHVFINICSGTGRQAGWVWAGSVHLVG